MSLQVALDDMKTDSVTREFGHIFHSKEEFLVYARVCAGELWFNSRPNSALLIGRQRADPGRNLPWIAYLNTLSLSELYRERFKTPVAVIRR